MYALPTTYAAASRRADRLLWILLLPLLLAACTIARPTAHDTRAEHATPTRFTAAK